MVAARRQRALGITTARRAADLARLDADRKRGGAITKTWLSHCLNEAKPADAIVVNEYWAMGQYLHFNEPGSFYKRHKDQFKNNDHRKFSLITYLNDNWQDEDGGQLQVYRGDTMQQIQPHAQTAVLFKSNETEHEVIKANRSRMSITGWLKVV